MILSRLCCPVEFVLQNHDGMVRQYPARGYGHLFPGLGVAASPVLLALYLEVTKAGYLEFTFFYQNSLQHFEDQFCDLLRLFPGEVQLFRNPGGDIRFCHESLPVAEMALKIPLYA
jgi:hypothetical protein